MPDFMGLTCLSGWADMKKINQENTVQVQIEISNTKEIKQDAEMWFRKQKLKGLTLAWVVLEGLI